MKIIRLGLQAKSLLPILFAASVAMALLHFVALPKSIENAIEHEYQTQQNQLQLFGLALLPDVISLDLATVYRTITEVLLQRKNWESITLVGMGGAILYPLGGTIPEHGKILSYELVNQGEQFGTVYVSIDISDRIDEISAEFLNLEILVLIAFAFIAVVNFFYQRRWINGPIKLLSKQSGLVAQGDYSTVERSHNGDELDQLMSLFNFMSRRLNVRENDLREAILKAENAAQVKSRFLAAMSHEIRTPLTGILGISDLLAGSDLDEEQEKWISNIRRSGKVLSSILDEVLDKSKLDAGKIELNFVPTDLVGLIDHIIHLFSGKAEENHTKLGFQVSNEVPAYILVDDVRLTQVISNIVGNAVKFTKDGAVDISLRYSEAKSKAAPDNSNGDNGGEEKKTHCEGPDGYITVQVTDTGTGIKDEALQSIFSAFTQADNSTSRKFGGTGLGLSIAKGLVELMSGTISAKSEYGKGSVFTIRIPVELAAETSEKTEELENLTNWASSHALSILVVDDVQVNRLLISAVFDQMKQTIDTAANGVEAINKVKSSDFDIILMDIRMPIMDGIEAVKEIRDLSTSSDNNLTHKSKVAIVALT
ncbi:MAG: ATP-binding protein, partial [Alphaproteobacteria bacterium]|nr:ATP-binding protein [Alphaproteobacteria bacterium]